MIAISYLMSYAFPLFQFILFYFFEREWMTHLKNEQIPGGGGGNLSQENSNRSQGGVWF